jgi:hypothetical protein
MVQVEASLFAGSAKVDMNGATLAVVEGGVLAMAIGGAIALLASMFPFFGKSMSPTIK